jgi:hypothetical protein
VWPADGVTVVVLPSTVGATEPVAPSVAAVATGPPWPPGSFGPTEAPPAAPVTTVPGLATDEPLDEPRSPCADPTAGEDDAPPATGVPAAVCVPADDVDPFVTAPATVGSAEPDADTGDTAVTADGAALVAWCGAVAPPETLAGAVAAAVVAGPAVPLTT